jgi:hypothetical protein
MLVPNLVNRETDSVNNIEKSGVLQGIMKREMYDESRRHYLIGNFESTCQMPDTLFNVTATWSGGNESRWLPLV